MARTIPAPCTQCGREPDGKYSGLQAWCSQCKMVGNSHSERLETIGKYWRGSYLRRKYGMTVDDYEWLVEHQGGVCAACGGRHIYRGNDKLIVDHDHETGEVRALLCEPCNLMLGLARDDEERLLKLAAYISSWKGGAR